jgi:Fuc2NAc and GlcNAc transferase
VSAILLTLLASVVLCGLYQRLARRWHILDRPNARSSHQLPTPHGGGLPLFSALLLGLVTAMLLGPPLPGVYLGMTGMALLLVGTGVVDDLRGLSVRARFVVYGLCCAVSAVLLLPPADNLYSAVTVVVAAVALLWMLNLYNFMDGIDGIAALQCIQAAFSAALLSWFFAADADYALYCLLLAAAHTGFLVWNWPPARLFMGDAGSVPTGYLLGALALLGAVQGVLPIEVWLILLAPFIVDASYTLGWRVLTGQPFIQPHRLHAYQRLSRHWGGHLPVDMALIAVHAAWLFPLALTLVLWPRFRVLLVILAYLPLLIGVAKARKLG